MFPKMYVASLFKGSHSVLKRRKAHITHAGEGNMEYALAIFTLLTESLAEHLNSLRIMKA